jgi:hypothetical protein
MLLVVQPDINKKMKEHLQANAEIVISQLGPISNMDFGYNRQSVEWLEGYIERLRQSGQLNSEEARQKLVGVFGSFLGECIARCYGGEWMDDDGMWIVAFSPGNAVFPFGKTQSQMENGLEDGIGCFFRGIATLYDRADLSFLAGGMQYMPAIRSAKNRQQIQIGSYAAILLTDIIGTSRIKYEFIMAVVDVSGKAVYFVTAEFNNMAKRFGGGSHFLGLFDGEGHVNCGDSDDWGNQDKFATEALRRIRQKFCAT